MIPETLLVIWCIGWAVTTAVASGIIAARDYDDKWLLLVLAGMTAMFWPLALAVAVPAAPPWLAVKGVRRYRDTKQAMLRDREASHRAALRRIAELERELEIGDPPPPRPYAYGGFTLAQLTEGEWIRRGMGL